MSNHSVATAVAQMANLMSGGKVCAVAIVTTENTSLGETLALSLSSRFKDPEDALEAIRMLVDQEMSMRIEDPEEFERIVNFRDE